MFAEDNQYYYGITVYTIGVSADDMENCFGKGIVQYVSLEFLTNIDPRIYYFYIDPEVDEATINYYEDCVVEINKGGVFWHE